MSLSDDVFKHARTGIAKAHETEHTCCGNRTDRVTFIHTKFYFPQVFLPLYKRLYHKMPSRIMGVTARLSLSFKSRVLKLKGAKMHFTA